MTSRVDSLIETALQSDNPWVNEAWLTLCKLGTNEVFQACTHLAQDESPTKRMLSASIAAQLENDKLREARIGLLLKLLEDETQEDVLGHVAANFRYIESDRALPVLKRMRFHPDPEVREGVVRGLLGQSPERVHMILIEMMSDPDSEVASWATLGVAQSEANDRATRDALFKKLQDDPDCEEAYWGLAARRDKRVIQPLTKYLSKPTLVELFAVTAASEFPQSEFISPLEGQVALAEAEGLQSALGLIQGALEACKEEQEGASG